MLLLLWMMLMHTAVPHVHHEHEEHSHHDSLENHGHHHVPDGGHKSDNSEKKSLLDLFFQNHTHTNHLPQSISVNQEKTTLVKHEDRKIVQTAVFSSEASHVSEEINSEKRKSPESLVIKSPFFNCGSLRGPPVPGYRSVV